MEGPPRPRDRAEFQIAVICALSLEANAVEAMFDETWEGDASYSKASGDPNAYTTGRIGKHNVVLAYMPRMGKVQAASVAAHLRSSFTNIKLALVTGICGGAPETVERLEGRELLLGDVVISTAVVQFDLARRFPDRTITKNTLEDNLGRPNHEISAILQKIQTPRRRKQLERQIAEHLNTLCNKDDFATSRYPGSAHDILYAPDYRHKHQDPDICEICRECEGDKDQVCNAALESTCVELKCDETSKCSRQRLSEVDVSGPLKPEIFLGRIASGDQVMKSGRHRATVAIHGQMSLGLGFEYT